jgi:glycosyltransferase involved in cell wall biosynthesis
MIDPAGASLAGASGSSEPARRVVQVSTSDVGGGAERIALDLHQAYRARGWSARLMVGHRHGGDLPGVVGIPGDEARGPLARASAAAAERIRPGAPRLARAAYALGQPVRSIRRLYGVEDFDFPGSRSVVEAAAGADLVHAHNLHGRYFDLRLLPEVTRRAPLLLTLHDAWLLSGHCAHSVGCDRWRTGCGGCPDLTLYPSVPRDATALNWRRKQAVYAGTGGVRIATPSRWLLDRVQESMLAPHLLDARVVHNGVDTEVFAPRPAGPARERLGLPAHAVVALCVGTGLRANPFKDYATLEAALRRLGADPTTPETVVLVLGDDHPDLVLGSLTMRFVAGTSGPAATAGYYDAADVFVHAARSDTFPTAVLEALSSGLPVVASAVGGIPEQVRSGDHEPPTGVLVPPGDAPALAAALGSLLADPQRRQRLGEAAGRDARSRFDARRQHAVYLAWAAEFAVPRRGSRPSRPGPAPGPTSRS